MSQSVDSLEKKNSIYVYYRGTRDDHSQVSLSIQISEEEINQAMAEAECSYQAWKKLQQRLLQFIEKDLKR